MTRIIISIFIALLIQTTSLAASNQQVVIKQIEFPTQRSHLKLRSTAIAKWMKFIDVYVAGLYASESSNPASILNGKEALSLDIGYLVALKREQLIEAAETSLARQHDAATLSQYQHLIDRVHASYQHINQGDRYRIDFRPGDGLRLLLNEELLINIKNDQFALLYLGIWLNENPLSERLRSALLEWTHS